MNRETNLKKVNERLYIEPCKREDGTDFEIKWEKKLEHLWLDLTEIKSVHTVAVDHPAFSDSRLFPSALGTVNVEDKWQYEEYQTQEWRFIRATGKLNKRREGSRRDSIGVIAKDGSTKHHVFTEGKVLIRRMDGDLTQADIEGKKVQGYMGHSKEDAHVYLEFSVPSEIFDNAYLELQEVKGKEVTLGVFADVFNSEVHRGLRDYWMPEEFFIEEESTGNCLYFSSLVISEVISTSPDTDISSEENNSEVTDDPNKMPTSIFADIADNIAHVRFLLIAILILLALKLFKFL